MSDETTADIDGIEYCGDCDPCIGGRRDQCAIFGKPTIGTHVHLDARPDHVRRAEAEMWRENEKPERERI
jgi:hypothetical protein